MAEWSPAAKQHLEAYLEELGIRAAARGLDVDDIVDGIAEHVRREVESNGAQVVTTEMLRQVLERVGRPEEILLEQPVRQREPKPPRVVIDNNDVTYLLFGTILPVMAILVELGTGIMGSLYLDPMPTVMHLALLCMVPATYEYMRQHVFYGRKMIARRGSFFLGASLTVSMLYTLVYLPTLPFSVLALLVLAGILGFVPIFCLIVGLQLLHRLRARTAVLGRHLLAGVAFALGAYLMLWFPE